jgi:hypothetical protein
MRSTSIRLVGVFLVVALTLVIKPQVLIINPALANSSCAGANVWHDGAYSNTGVWGAHSYIVTRQAPFCTTSTSSSNLISAWTMVQSYPFGSNVVDGYMQSGYAEVYGQFSTMQWYAEYRQSDSYPYHRELAGQTGLLGTPSSGSTHQYTESYDSLYPYGVMYIDNSEVMDTNFNPYNYWHGPWLPMWAGETHDTGDSIPGNINAHTTFSSMGMQLSQGGGFTGAYNETIRDDVSNCYAWNYPNFNDTTTLEIWEESGC